jgi:hypothetical protein
MPVYIPRKAAIGLAKETTSGTYVAPRFWTPHQSMGLENQPEVVADNSAIGVIEEAFDAEALFNHAEGTIEGLAYDDAIGLYLLSMFGTVNSAVTDDESEDVSDHVFTVSQANTRPTLSVTEKSPNKDVNFTMAVVGSFSLTAEAKQFVRYSAEMISRASATNSPASTPAVAAGNRFVPSGVSLKIADDAASLNAGTVIPLRSVTVNFTNGAEHDPDALGHTTPASMVTKTFNASISFEGLYRDDTLRALHLLSTKKALQIVITNGAVTIGDNSRPTLTLTFERGYFNPWSDSTDLDALATQSTTFNMLYSVASSKSVTATLRNLEAGY